MPEKKVIMSAVCGYNKVWYSKIKSCSGERVIIDFLQFIEKILFLEPHNRKFDFINDCI